MRLWFVDPKPCFGLIFFWTEVDNDLVKPEWLKGSTCNLVHLVKLVLHVDNWASYVKKGKTGKKGHHLDL